MGLELRKGRKGELLPYWYGRIESCGKSRVVNLNVKWRGVPPTNLRLKGDDLFEASREEAKDKFDDVQVEAGRKGRSQHLTERLIEAKTGQSVNYAMVAELPRLWRTIDRPDGQPTEAHLKWCDSVFRRFEATVPVVYLYEVKQNHTTAFLEMFRKTRTRKTVKDATTLLRSAFGYFLPVGIDNPFGKTIRRKKARTHTEADMVARRPLTVEQLASLYATARPDPFLYPLVVCAACTGMRIGDVCRLRWQSVDLKNGWIRVATSKTGVQIEVPLFESLYNVLKNTPRTDNPYVWPDAAYMYDNNLTGITYRGKVLFAKAFAEAVHDTSKSSIPTSCRVDLIGAMPKVVEAVQNAGFAPDKCKRILDTLVRYGRGESYRTIQKETGRARSVTSEDLSEAEKVSGLNFRKGPTHKTGYDLKSLIKGTRQKRGDGRLSASILGWHNLRGTFVVLALQEGIPFETVAKCTGHTTATTVRDHYYNPTREHTRQAMRRVEEHVSGKKLAPRASLEPNIVEIAKQLEQLSASERAQLTHLLARVPSTV